MSINIRISKVCELRNIKQTDLVNKGFGSKQTVSFIFNEKQKPNPLFLDKFLRMFTDVDARWLITGEGKMFQKKEKSTENKIVSEPATNYTNGCDSCRDKDVEIRLLIKQAKEKDEKIYDLQKAVGALEHQLSGGNDSNKNGSMPATG